MAVDSGDGTTQRWRCRDPPEVARSGPGLSLRFGAVPREGVAGRVSWASQTGDAASPHCPASYSQPRKLKTHAISRSFSEEFSGVPKCLRGKGRESKS